MLIVELLKILKRKLNYIYLAVSILFLLSTHFIKNAYFPNLEVSSLEFLFDYSFKTITSLTIFFVVYNLIFSYAKDYNDKIAKLVRFSKVTRFYNIFTKMMVNYIMGAIYYSILLSVYLAVFYRDFNTLLSKEMKNNLVLSLLLVLFATNIALLMAVIFTRVTLALPLTILLVTSLTFIREIASEYFKIQLVEDIFSHSFSKLSVQLATLDMVSSIQLLVYTLGILIFSTIIKVIKNN